MTSAMQFGPVHNSYGMVQPNTGAELHTVAILPDVFVTAYVEDPDASFYGGVDDRAYHMVVAGRVNPDLSITFGTPYPSSQYNATFGYFDDLSDLCYVGNNVVMVGNRRNPPATFLHVDTDTLAITEIGAIYSPAVAGGETSPGNAVKAMSNHDGNALVIFDYDSGGGYWMAWVTTDGSSISYTWDNAPSDEVGYWFTWATSHWVPVADGVIASGGYGAIHYIIDWAGQSISFAHVSATDMWTSFAEESAVTTPAPGASTYDLVWVTTTDTLRFAADIPISSTTATSTWSPIHGQRIGQATAQPYAYFTNMARLPDQSFLLTWMNNNGNTRYLTWFRDGQHVQTWPIAKLDGSSFWYYDGVTINSLGDGRFVLAWTENAEGVEDWGNEIYWQVGQLVDSACEVHPEASLLDPYSMGESRSVCELSPSKALHVWWSDTGDPDYDYLLRAALFDTSGTVPTLLGMESMLFPYSEFGVHVDASCPHSYRINDTRAVIDLTQEHDFNEGWWVMVDAAGDTPVLTRVQDPTYSGSTSGKFTGWGQVRNQRLVRAFVRRPVDGPSTLQVWNLSGATPSLVASHTLDLTWAGQCAWDSDDTFVVFDEPSWDPKILTFTVTGSSITQDGTLTLDGPTYGYLYEDYRTATPSVATLPDGRVFFSLGTWNQANSRNFYTFDRAAGVQAQGQLTGDSMGWMVSVAANTLGEAAVFAHDNLGPNTYLVTTLSVWRDGVGFFMDTQPIGPDMPYSGWYTEAAVTAAGCKWLLTRADTYAGAGTVNDQRIVICDGCGVLLIPPPLRLRQRDDTLSVVSGAAPRLGRAGAAASSAQQQRAPRLGAGGKPVTSGLGQVYL